MVKRLIGSRREVYNGTAKRTSRFREKGSILQQIWTYCFIEKTCNS